MVIKLKSKKGIRREFINYILQEVERKRSSR